MIRQSFSSSPMKRRPALTASVSAVALSMGLGAPAAAAQDAEDTSLTFEEIIVSATKRNESIQDVPLSMTALTGDFTRQRNLEDVKDLVAYAPGVSGGTANDSFIDFLAVRGIITNDFGVGGDPSVGFFKNGLYQGRNGAVITSLFDMDRAEILRGPQGFLFGRNSIAGAVSVHTARPVIGSDEGYVTFDIGERNRKYAEGALNIPVNDQFAVRVAAYGGMEDGFATNLTRPNDPKLGEEDVLATRVSAVYDDGEKFDAFLNVEYENRDRNGTFYRPNENSESYATVLDYLGLDPVGGGPRDVESDLPAEDSRDEAELFSVGLELNFDLGFATLTSLSGFKTHDYIYAEDFDALPVVINNYGVDQRGDYLETELRLVSSEDSDSPLSWYAGVSYYDEDLDADFSQSIGEEVYCNYYSAAAYEDAALAQSCYDYLGIQNSADGLLTETGQVRGRYHGWAAYFDLTYDVSEAFDISFGLRYTEDTRDFALNVPEPESELGPAFAYGFTTDGFISDRRSWDAFTPRFVARYRPNDDLTFFASVTRGFKAGGFGTFQNRDGIAYTFDETSLNLTNADTGPNFFDPEKSWSYEAGVKGVLKDGRVQFDLSTFYYTYRDLQVTVPSIEGGGTVVDNVGRAKGYGIEGSVNMDLGDYLNFYAAAGWIDSEINDVFDACGESFDCEGNQLPAAASFMGSAVLSLNVPMSDGAFIATLEGFGQTSTFGEDLSRSLSTRVPGFVDMTLRAGFQWDTGWSVIAYAENITDESYFGGGWAESGILPATLAYPATPRTFGVMVTYEFGR